MKANELRQGNYILGIYEDDSTEEIKESVCIFLGNRFTENYFDVESDDYIEEFIDFKPIPLTEEWLLKLGFEYANSREYMSFNLFRTVRLLADYSDNFSIVTLRINDTTIEFKYVHQIQNLHFALKQEELQIINNQ